MLLFVWMCVMTSAFFPGGERIAALQARSYQSHVRAAIEAPPLLTLGWASRDVEFTVPAREPLDVHERIRAAQAAFEALPLPTPRARKPRRLAA